MKRLTVLSLPLQLMLPVACNIKVLRLQIYDRKLRMSLESNLRSQFTILAYDLIYNPACKLAYDPSIVVLQHCIVITIVNYDCKTFIASTPSYIKLRWVC